MAYRETVTPNPGIEKSPKTCELVKKRAKDEREAAFGYKE
jgi:hypothetical protein